VAIITSICARWCLVCGADHGDEKTCPGEVRATGPEVDVWRITVETPRGLEAYGVLVAPTNERWRARILTYPRVLWTVPGGTGGTIKFVAGTRDEAARKARDFVREHCARKGYVMHDEMAVIDVPVASVNHSGVQREPRFTRVLPVRFGPGRPIARGMTGNLSESGLFVVTQYPPSEGDQLGLLVQLEHCSVPLRGSVIWRRAFPAPARPAGMGLRLLDPPKVYRRYVHALS
jgi:hypothetical protein